MPERFIAKLRSYDLLLIGGGLATPVRFACSEIQNRSGRCTNCRIAATVRGEMSFKKNVSASTVAGGMA